MSSADLPQLQRLLAIMARLRDPVQGCEWDLAQSVKSLAPYVIEEAYELADAINRGDLLDWREELGDVLLQVVFQAQLASEQGDFDFDQVAGVIADKLIRRHPHIFPDGRMDQPRLDLTPEQVSTQWQVIKTQEKALATAERKRLGLPQTMPGFLDKVGAGHPPLQQAEKLLARAAEVGYEWTDPRDLLKKLREEVDELEAAVEQGLPTSELQDELGDVLFCTTNLARVLKLDSEQALFGGIDKFRRRFGFIEQCLLERGESLSSADLEMMVALWAEAKSMGL
jgi:ATP diphosphatase